MLGELGHELIQVDTVLSLVLGLDLEDQELCLEIGRGHLVYKFKHLALPN